MTEALGWDTVAAVAERFHWRVRVAAKDHLRKIDDLNAHQKELCASHLYCEANDLFAEAFFEVLGRNVNVSSGYDMAAYDIGWGIAKRRGFNREWGIGR